MKKIVCLMLTVLCAALSLCACQEADAVSGSDVPDGERTLTLVWEQAESDEAYIEMMRGKLNEFIVCVTGLSGEQERLSQLGSARKVRADAAFSELEQQLSLWCMGAQAYPENTLAGADTRDICAMLRQLGETAQEYLEAYPDMVSGTYSGETGMDEYETAIIDSAAEIFERLNAQ